MRQFKNATYIVLLAMVATLFTLGGCEKQETANQPPDAIQGSEYSYKFSKTHKIFDEQGKHSVTLKISADDEETISDYLAQEPFLEVLTLEELRKREYKKSNNSLVESPIVGDELMEDFKATISIEILNDEVFPEQFVAGIKFRKPIINFQSKR